MFALLLLLRGVFVNPRVERFWWKKKQFFEYWSFTKSENELPSLSAGTLVPIALGRRRTVFGLVRRPRKQECAFTQVSQTETWHASCGAKTSCQGRLLGAVANASAIRITFPKSRRSSKPWVSTFPQFPTMGRCPIPQSVHVWTTAQPSPCKGLIATLWRRMQMSVRRFA